MALSFDVNWIAVLVAAVVNMVLGSLWYGPIFGKKWMAEMGFTEKDKAKAKEKGMAACYAKMFVSSLVMIWVLANLINYMGSGTFVEGAIVGATIWLGFIATVLFGGVLWEGKSCTLYCINAGYWLVNLAIVGGILAIW